MAFVPKTVTITIRLETHKKLQSVGQMGQTFDDVISKLLETRVHLINKKRLELDSCQVANSRFPKDARRST